MLKLVSGVEIYAPEPLGVGSLLIGAERFLKIVHVEMLERRR